MADSSSLLSPQHDSPPELQLYEADVVLPSLETTIEQLIGTFGSAQLIQAIIVSLAWLFDAQQTFISVFTDKQPLWHCTTRANDTQCLSAVTPCGLPKDSWEWDRPSQASVVSEWNLICASPLISGLPASSFFIGCLASGLLLTTLADSFLGRKKMLLFSCLAMSLSGVLTIFSPNVWVYSALRFVSGCGRAAVGTCALVLSTEVVGKKWRGEIGILGFLFFSAGFLSLPAIAFMASQTSWRALYLWTSIPALCYCMVAHFFVHESPRWLLLRGRKDEAIQTLQSIALSNGKILISSFSRVPTGDEETQNLGIFSAMKILFEKRWAFRRLSAIIMVGFGLGMVYYGMPLGLGNLDFNLYLGVAFNALSELPSALLTFFLIGRLKRRLATLGFAFLSGVCSVLCVFLGGGERKYVQMVVELVSFFSGCTALNVLLIYTLELFPTCVRNSALSIVRQALVLGGAFSPVLAVAGRKEPFLSFGVFGMVTGACGLFVIRLPETKGGVLCDTIEEEEVKAILS